MIAPLLLTDPFETTWYHGTNTSPFDNWQCPPPPPSPGDVAHTGLFFTANQDFAKAAGTNVCTIALRKNIKLIAPAQGGVDSANFRRAVAKSHPLAEHCQWLINDAAWNDAWSTGEVMRFSYNPSDFNAVLCISKALTSIAVGLKKNTGGSISEKDATAHAMTSLTRAWIEQLVRVAKDLGYQAIQGAEIDRWTSGSTTVAQPWLAVMDISVISSPNWL